MRGIVSQPEVEKIISLVKPIEAEIKTQLSGNTISAEIMNLSESRGGLLESNLMGRRCLSVYKIMLGGN